jgi:hypothetical protein
MLNRRGFIVVLLLTAAIVAFATSKVRAHDHATLGAAGPFYETWKMPDAPWISCCSEQDCAAALKATQDPMGNWHAQRESDGKWFAIPPEKVELNRDSPDGRSHLCVLNDRVLCFLPAAGI